MELLVTILLFLVGLGLIIRGGDLFLDGAVALAEATGMPRFLIGGTVVSLATTLPEMVVSVTGVLSGETELAVGNAVGSVTANLGLILGISALVLPARVAPRQFVPKALIMVAAALLLYALCGKGSLSIFSSVLLLGVFAAYLAAAILDAKRERTAERRSAMARGELQRKLLIFALGIALIVIGSRLLIRYGSDLALRLGIPAAVVGVTMVAVGTSLPELVTTVTALARKEASMSVGNIIGANIIDLALILPVCSALSGGRLTISAGAVGLDLPVCLIFCILAALPPILGGRFYRWQGAVLLGLYALYTVVLVV